MLVIIRLKMLTTLDGLLSKRLFVCSRFMSVDCAGSVNQTLPFYEYKDRQGADFPLNMALTQLGAKGPCGGGCVYDTVHAWLGLMPDHRWSSWVVSHFYCNCCICSETKSVYTFALVFIFSYGFPVWCTPDNVINMLILYQSCGLSVAENNVETYHRKE